MGCHEDKKHEHDNDSAIAPEGSLQLICMKEYYVQDKLAIVRTDWKLHAKVQNENEATF